MKLEVIVMCRLQFSNSKTINLL